jgi:hypothetical protein
MIDRYSARGFPENLHTSNVRWRTRAAFRLLGARNWQWHTWTHNHGNKHAAIHEKATELGAVAWDFGNADHAELSRQLLA